jgi:hypothetical protein
VTRHVKLPKPLDDSIRVLAEQEGLKPHAFILRELAKIIRFSGVAKNPLV